MSADLCPWVRVDTVDLYAESLQASEHAKASRCQVENDGRRIGDPARRALSHLVALGVRRAHGSVPEAVTLVIGCSLMTMLFEAFVQVTSGHPFVLLTEIPSLHGRGIRDSNHLPWCSTPVQPSRLSRWTTFAWRAPN